MKSVMISIRPKWCELIANGKKTIEVRKSRPKLETPFKCYMYMTKDCKKHYYIDEYGDRQVELIPQKVIGEFVCDKIYGVAITGVFDDGKQIEFDILKHACLTNSELLDYIGIKNAYGWHITDLKIYDTPKSLNDFKNCAYPQKECLENQCEYWGYYGCGKRIPRPPQSWCYVEELKA
ncbi:MAG: hypothetical protein NC350_03960 [Corallococcus sp.]|nr:hypothetical protein [Corallococcus sp.]